MDVVSFFFLEKECAQVEKNKSIKHEKKIVRSFRKSKVGVILLNEETLRSGKGDVDLTSWAMVGLSAAPDAHDG